MMNSRVKLLSYLFVFVGIVVSACSALVGCAQSEADVLVSRPDLVTIDFMSEFGPLARPPIAFPHDLHTAALNEQGKGCDTCHLRMENGRQSPKYLRLVDEDKDTVMAVYHDHCIACHSDTAESGSKSGPTICGDCHRRRAKYVSSRQPIGFDRSLHQRHVEGVGSECGKCHHQYDEATGTLFYAKGKEGTCRYCHASKYSGDVVTIQAKSSWHAPTLAAAAHWACLGCHSDMPHAGPTKCSGCHSAEAQRQIVRIAHPKRLERGQPDFVLLHASEADLDETEMNTVPFSHINHEDFQETCRTCHHAAISTCVECHTLQGDEKAHGVPLQRAMHDMGSDHSCVGCHNRQKEDRNCKGCHAQIEKRGLTEHACTICHIGPPPGQVMAVKSRYTSLSDFTPPPGQTRLSFEEEDIPETITIDALGDRYRPSVMLDQFGLPVMPHRKIVYKLMEYIGESRLATRFHGQDDVVCQGCHHHSPVGQKPPLCESCHGEPFNPAALLRPGLYGALHRQCVGCHQSMEIRPSSSDCVGCHAQKPTQTSRLSERSSQ